ncbi:O-methyltransferase [Jeotgalicoccus aerolatus]|uniref:O-methyltransferase YrrM n=2 Tax=Jeotgalicoccus aerolatus TaxID=709510 RepID=A0ABS4HLD3_9STAP|nr:O-methyltransferase [Jeotgalicoccus aerolatus]MBP1951653.1 putative O-methyltransferase YrrM [Jeotgalicoccus aerolatus]NMA80676.1 O-methyltransferase [Jeotgalicoccus aerolatus]GGD95838.1 O-methyltransferase [Jeotgalicoccus aerolatus]HJG33679.1 O-methyltransferase [Jeotgalicoccus aerolatus]
MELIKYVRDLNTMEELFPAIHRYALENRVPVIDSDALNVVKQYIQIKGAKNILEIGTAIGYSALHFASAADGVHVTTIEKDEASHNLAKDNINAAGFSNKITAILADAKEVDLKDGRFDFLFIDASKGNNQLFFDKYKEYLTDDALIIVDNIFVRGLITDDNVENRNKRKLRDKVRNFNQAMKDSEYSTSFLNVGDGLLVIY